MTGLKGRRRPADDDLKRVLSKLLVERMDGRKGRKGNPEVVGVKGKRLRNKNRRGRNLSLEPDSRGPVFRLREFINSGKGRVSSKKGKYEIFEDGLK